MSSLKSIPDLFEGVREFNARQIVLFREGEAPAEPNASFDTRLSRSFALPIPGHTHLFLFHQPPDLGVQVFTQLIKLHDISLTIDQHGGGQH